MRDKSRSIRVFMWSKAGVVFCLALGALFMVINQVHGQSGATQRKTMKHYAMIFRASRELTPEELKQREIDIQVWVKRVTEMGVTLDPRILGEVVTNLSSKGGEIVSRTESADPSLAAVVYFDAASKEEAVEIARIHPSLHYGVILELREWSSPRRAVAAE